MNYIHTQRSPLWLVLATITVAVFVAAVLMRDQLPNALAVGSAGIAMLLVTLSFQTLTVADEGATLAIRFGPLPLFRKRIAYTAISDVQASHTALIDGWGIHYIPGRGWTWNLWGRPCVQLTVNGRTLRIGTDDADTLAQFIRTKVGA